MRRAAPQAEIGIVCFAGPVDAAAHHGNRDLVLFGVTSHLANLFGEFDKRFVLDSRTTRATDDVERLQTIIDETANAAGGDVVQNLPPRSDFFRLAMIRPP